MTASLSSGRFWTKRILLGGRYSSGTTAAAAGPVGLRPAPLAAFDGRPDCSPPGAGRLRRCCSASRAFFLSAAWMRVSPPAPNEATDGHGPMSARRTFLCCSSPLVLLELLLSSKLLHCCIAPGPGQRHLHGLLKQVEAIGLLCSLLGRIGVVIHNKGLTFRLQIGLGDDIDDIAELRKDLAEGILEGVNLDALLEVPHIDAGERMTC